VNTVTNMAIWGNHSSTQYPDFQNARISGQLVTEVISDRAWLEGGFIAAVQQRGAVVLKARGASSAASAANAVIDTVRSIREDTPAGDWHSVCLRSDGSYGIEPGLVCSFPVRSGGRQEIVPGIELNSLSRARIDASVKELKEEKAMVADILPS
jgi:malate dehydrogenase